MLVAFTITDIKCLVVGLLYDLLRPFHVYILGMKYFDSTICLVSGITTKAAHSPYSSSRLSGQFIFKQNILCKFRSTN